MTISPLGQNRAESITLQKEKERALQICWIKPSSTNILQKNWHGLFQMLHGPSVFSVTINLNLVSTKYNCVRLVVYPPALQYFPLTSLQLQPPATSQVIVFFSHSTPTLASSSSLPNTVNINDINFSTYLSGCPSIQRMRLVAGVATRLCALGPSQGHNRQRTKHFVPRRKKRNLWHPIDFPC